MPRSWAGHHRTSAQDRIDHPTTNIEFFKPTCRICRVGCLRRGAMGEHRVSVDVCLGKPVALWKPDLLSIQFLEFAFESVCRQFDFVESVKEEDLFIGFAYFAVSVNENGKVILLSGVDVFDVSN